MQTAWTTVISRHSVNCGLPDGSLCFHFIYMFELNVCLSPCLFPLLPPSLPPSLVVSWKVLPGILKKHCCILPDRNTGKGQTRCPLPSKHTSLTHTRAHTQASTQSWEAREHSQWEWPVGGNAGEWMLSRGGSHLSFSLHFFFFLVRSGTSVSSERNCRLHVHSLLMSFT